MVSPVVGAGGEAEVGGESQVTMAGTGSKTPRETTTIGRDLQDAGTITRETTRATGRMESGKAGDAVEEGGEGEAGGMKRRP